MSIAVQKIRYEVGWTENEKGLVLSAFYWGYMLGQLPVAWFVQRYGAKLVFGLSVLLPSILSLLVPIACRTSLISALFLRCLIGLFESACFPAVYYLFPIWIPLKEKSLMVSCIASGMYMGEMIGVSVSGIIADHTILINGEDWGGWPSVFYLFGVLGILWFPYWIYCAAESPDTHPSITPDEVALIKEGKEENQTAKEESFNEEDVEESSNNSSGLTMRRIKLNLTHRNHSYTQISSNTPERNPIHSNSNRLDSNFSSLMNAVDDHDSSDDQPVSSDSIKIHQKHHYSKEFIAHNPPWLLFFTTPLCYVYFLNSWTFGFMNLTLISEIPSFFNDQLGFNLQSSGLLGILPFFTLFVATVAFGMIFEYCQEVLGWKTRTVRQVAEYIAFGASSLVLIGCGFVQDRPYLAYFLMVLSQLFFGASQCGIICSYSDIAPNYAGLLTSIGNCLGSLAGICGPIIVSSLTSTPSLDPIWGWRIFFLLTALFSLISLVLWSLYQTSDIVSELNTPHDSSR